MNYSFMCFVLGLGFLFCCPLVGFGQMTTEYFDEDWNPTEEEQAVYYREITYDAEGKPVGEVRQYRMDGIPVFIGQVSSVFPEFIPDGVCKEFHPNGKIRLERNFHKGIPIGYAKQWDENGIAIPINFLISEEKTMLLDALNLSKAEIDTAHISALMLMGKEIYEKEQSLYNAMLLQYLAYELAIEMKHLEQAGTALNNIGVFYHRIMERFNEALAVFEIAMEIKVWSDRALGKASTLNNIGSVLQSKGDFRQALQNYEAAKIIFSKNKNWDELYATTLNNIGELYSEQGYIKLALAYLQEAKGIFEKKNKQIQLSSVYGNIGRCYHEQGNYNKALAYYEKAKKVQKENNLPIKMANTINKMGETFSKLGEFESSKACFYKAYQIFKDNHQSIKQGVCVHNLATFYRSTGLIDSALIYSQTALQIFKEIGYKLGVAKALNTIGNIFDTQAKYENALEAFKQALAISMELNILDLQATCLSNMSLIYQDLRKFGESLKFLRKALSIKKKHGLGIGLGITYNNLALVHYKLNNLDSTIFYLNLGINHAKTKQEKHSQAYLLANKGSTLTLLRQSDEANKALRQSILLYDSLDLVPVKSIVLAMLADNEFIKKDFKTAIKYYKQAEKEQQKFGMTNNLRVTLNNLGYAYFERKKYKKALSTFRRQIDIIEELFSFSFGDMSQFITITNSGNAVEGAINCIHLLKENEEDAFYYSEKFRARTLNRLLTESSLDTIRLPKNLLAETQRINEGLRAINTELSNKLTKSLRTVLLNRKKDLLEQFTYLKANIREQVPEFYNLNYPPIIDTKKVKTILDKNEVLVEFFLGDNDVYAFLLGKEEYRFLKLGKSKSYNQLTSSFQTNYLHPQKQILQKNNNRELKRLKKVFHQHAHALYKTLWQPLEATGLLKNKKIILIPDGPLHYLPFELLVRDSTKKEYDEYNYLIKDYEITYYPSATVLHYERTKTQKAPAPKDFFGLGVKDFKNNHCYEEDYIQFRQLDQTIAQVQAIAQLFPEKSRQTLLLEEANKQQFKAATLKDYRYIHIASHGLINAENPNFSKILLHNDCLNLYEMFDLDLNAELVSLSACETGLGQLVRGEGMVGFTRALMYAGTPSVILSLWEVFDDSTSSLFVNYYQQLKNTTGVDKYMPLRATQLKMIEDGGKHANPYYWAPFVFIGAR